MLKYFQLEMLTNTRLYCKINLLSITKLKQRRIWL